MSINCPTQGTAAHTVTVALNIKAGFTGMMVVQMENGAEKAHYPLRSNEFTGSLESFLSAARMAGYQVIPPAIQG